MSSRTFTYRICVRGTLPVERWREWFDDTEFRQTEDGDTVLISTLIDQAALYGLLARLRDLALPLISVQLIENNETH